MDTALLAIDLQRDFLEETGRLPVSRDHMGPLITNANRLLQHSAQAGWQVIFIRNEFWRHDWIGNFSRNQAAIEGTPGAEIDPRITVPTGALVLSKAKADGFCDPGLEAALKSAGIRRIIAFGIMTEECVLATVTSAIERGYLVTAISDAVASEKESDRRSGISQIKRVGANVCETSDLLEGAMAPPTSPARTA